MDPNTELSGLALSVAHVLKKCDDMSCMKEITVDMVFNAVKEVLTST